MTSLSALWLPVKIIKYVVIIHYLIVVEGERGQEINTETQLIPLKSLGNTYCTFLLWFVTKKPYKVTLLILCSLHTRLMRNLPLWPYTDTSFRTLTKYQIKILGPYLLSAAFFQLKGWYALQGSLSVDLWTTSSTHAACKLLYGNLAMSIFTWRTANPA